MITVDGAEVVVGSGSLVISTASPQPLGTAAPGSTGQVSDAGHVHPTPSSSSLGYIVVPPLSSPAGWTTVNGSGSASIGSGLATLTLGAGVIPGSWANEPKVLRTPTLSTFAIDVRARIAVWTGGDSNRVNVSFGIRAGSASSEGLFATVRGNGGSVELASDSISGNGSLGATTVPTRANISGGQFWLRLMTVPNGASLFYGIGVANAAPSNWLVVHSTTNTTNWQSQYLASIVMALNATNTGSPDNITVSFDNISYRIIGL